MIFALATVKSNRKEGKMTLQNISKLLNITRFVLGRFFDGNHPIQVTEVIAMRCAMTSQAHKSHSHDICKVANYPANKSKTFSKNIIYNKNLRDKV